ncbi:uncharacterized protein METZ01_LOCUS366915, partial [marine metagenome]
MPLDMIISGRPAHPLATALGRCAIETLTEKGESCPTALNPWKSR